MTVPEPVPGHVPAPVPMTPREWSEDAPMTRERFIRELEITLPGPGFAMARKRLLLAAGSYAANLAEQIARPDDRWEPK